MNDLEFRQQVLDTLSPSFCGAKWFNATIWLGSGMSTSCHHPPAHLVDADKVRANPRLLHNTPQKKDDRKKMIAGERPRGCEYCWKIEDMGRDAVSDRVYKSKIYPIEALHEAYRTPADQDINLRTLEIAFDRTCQFACSYCNPAFSTTWVNDIRRNGAYVNLESDGRNHFTHTHESSQPFRITENNPYIDAFFAWWESDLHRTLQELRITGGEPLMSGHTWKLIDWFKENQGKSTTRLAINSNLGAEVDVDRLLASVQGMNVEIYTSMEATGVAATGGRGVSTVNSLSNSSSSRSSSSSGSWFQPTTGVSKGGVSVTSNSSSVRSGRLFQIQEKSAEILASTAENGVAVVTRRPK